MTGSVNLTSPAQVRALLESRGLQPNQMLGQSFLIDANIRDIIVDAADVGPGDVVLEVGPGLGVITEPLAGRARRVIAVEKDSGLFRWLQESMGNVPNLQLIHADALDIIPEQAPGWGVTRLVSNLPYSVGSRILMDVFALPDPPLSITVTIQLEVADRLAADAGHPERGLLSVWAQRWYDVKVVKKISPACFMPRPKVMSAVVRLTRHGSPPAGDGAFFREVTRACFGYRRKQIGTILSRVAEGLKVEAATALAALGELGIDPRLRPETFTVDTWERLAARLSGQRSGSQGTGSL